MTKTTTPPITPSDAARIEDRFDRAWSYRRRFEALWRDCYDYALPLRSVDGGRGLSASNPGDRLFDGTAIDAVDQLAASLLGHVTPPWSDWFGFKAGPAIRPEDAVRLAPVLDETVRIIQSQFDQSNFSMEIHQSYLDLVVGGTACLLCQETDPGSLSALRFAAIPLCEVAFEEGPEGRLESTFRRYETTLTDLQGRYADLLLPAQLRLKTASPPTDTLTVYEAVLRRSEGYHLVLMVRDGSKLAPIFHTLLPESPFINFRWMKSPGEIYGRSPVMKALPDIKTANKVVELILQNASIAVTGMWQADDDGVLNPDTIEFKPGTIIPKAVGSSGLKPLEMPGNFDVSQLVLGDLRGRIRHALLADKLNAVQGPRMSATEILERSAEMSLLLGANYGRLQTELLTPLIQRVYGILQRRGVIADLPLDGRSVILEYRSPLARAQGQRNIQNTLSWIDSLGRLGRDGLANVNVPELARFLGDSLGVPARLLTVPVPAPLPLSPLTPSTKEI